MLSSLSAGKEAGRRIKAKQLFLSSEWKTAQCWESRPGFSLELLEHNDLSISPQNPYPLQMGGLGLLL